MNIEPTAPALRSHVCCLLHEAVTACNRKSAGLLLTLTVTFAADAPSPSCFLAHPMDAMCLMCNLCFLQAADVSSGVGAGLVELDENGSVMMGGEQQGPPPLQGSTGASSEDLDSLEALRSISQVGFAAPSVLSTM